jgi:hypothetical protein
MVVQPSGTDCIAVAKYEKIGKDFLVKIKTRMICLLDPHRIREYLQLFDVGKNLSSSKKCLFYVYFFIRFDPLSQRSKN